MEEQIMGVLSGYTVIEMAGIGPSPMTGMMLADMGARVIRIERTSEIKPNLHYKDASMRGKKSIALNVKTKEGRDILLKLIETADVLTEGFRPGVMEKLGLCPEECLKINPKLVYGRMTGWGQEGPLAKTAGHDLNYIAITGALWGMGPKDRKPPIPLNLIGDMGGGGMLLTVGILGALLETKTSGKGQVIDAAMVDGASQLMWMFHGFQAMNFWNGNAREANVLDGAAPFYDTYDTSDGKWVTLGPIEPQFFAEFVRLFGLESVKTGDQMNHAKWPETKAAIAAHFKTKTRDEWCKIFDGTDACFAPVLNMNEAVDYAHNAERNAFVNVDGFPQPAPAPLFSRTPSNVAHGAKFKGEDTKAVLTEYGYSETEIAALSEKGALPGQDTSAAGPLPFKVK
jgi:alpha-methylacyl-CoA racemase